MARPSAYERQKRAAAAAKQTGTSPNRPATKKSSTGGPTSQRTGGRRVAPPYRPIAETTTNLAPDGTVLFEVLLTPDQVAMWLAKPKSTLYAWRSRGQGPTAIKVGSDLRYRRSDVEAWLDSQVLDQPA